MSTKAVVESTLTRSAAEPKPPLAAARAAADWIPPAAHGTSQIPQEVRLGFCWREDPVLIPWFSWQDHYTITMSTLGHRSKKGATKKSYRFLFLDNLPQWSGREPPCFDGS